MTKEKGCGFLVPYTFELLMLCPANLLDWVGWRGVVLCQLIVQASDQSIAIAFHCSSCTKEDKYAMFDGGVEAMVGGVGGQGVYIVTTMRRWRWYIRVSFRKQTEDADFFVCEKDNGKRMWVWGLCVDE